MNEEKEDGIIEKITKWIKENYIKVLTVFLLISFLFTGLFLWSSYQEQKSQEASIIYDQFSLAMNKSDNDLSEALKIKTNFERNYSNQIYLDLMNMQLSKRYISIGNLTEAINFLKEANNSLESKGSDVFFIRDLSRIRLSLLLISQEEFEEAKEILNKNFSFYEPLKYEFLGDLEKELQNSSVAKEHFENALSMTESETHKDILNVKISALAE